MAHVQLACEVSERRACRTLGQPLSTQRYEAKTKGDEPPLLKRIFELVGLFPRFGYRRITELLRGEGWQVNAKRIYRLWRQEGLKVPKKTNKKRRLGTSAGGITRRSAEFKNHVWSVDFIFDRTSNGRPLKILVLIDEFTRECLALEAHRKFTSDQFVELIGRIILTRGVPKYIRSDNGPEFISKRVRNFLEKIEIGASYIEPGSPWQNGFVESFNSRFRDECLNCEEFTTLQEAQQVIQHWMETYNYKRPHSSLGGLTPVAFGNRCSALPNVAPLHLAKPSNETTTQTVPS